MTTEQDMRGEFDNKLLSLIQRHFPNIPVSGKEHDESWSRWLAFARDCAALSAQKPGQAQPVVGLPEPEHNMQDVRCQCCGYMTYHREHMGCIRSATAKTAEAVRELVGTLSEARDDVHAELNNLLPHAGYASYDRHIKQQKDLLARIDAAIAKYAPKEQDNG